MKSLEGKILQKASQESAATKKHNEKGIGLVNEINELFRRAESEFTEDLKQEIRDKLSQYRRFLLKNFDKDDVEEILEKYYKKLESL